MCALPGGGAWRGRGLHIQGSKNRPHPPGCVCGSGSGCKHGLAPMLSDAQHQSHTRTHADTDNESRLCVGGRKVGSASALVRVWVSCVRACKRACTESAFFRPWCVCAPARNFARRPMCTHGSVLRVSRTDWPLEQTQVCLAVGFAPAFWVKMHFLDEVCMRTCTCVRLCLRMCVGMDKRVWAHACAHIVPLSRAPLISSLPAPLPKSKFPDAKAPLPPRGLVVAPLNPEPLPS